MDLGLSINLSMGEKISSYQKSTLDALKMRRPVLDLQLSLSTGSTESDITTVSQQFPCYKYSDMGDEGSMLSLVPQSQNVGISCPSNQTHIYSNLLLTSNISPIVVEKPNLVCSINKQQQCKTIVKRCRSEGCTKGSRGVAGLCISHGGGRRCQRDGCQNNAEGKTIFCKVHGGGRRCQHLGCTKSAEGRSDYCIGHGGGRRCNHEDCPHAARGKSGLCIRHGGGKRCKIENCNKSAEGVSGLCISHGGGRRCQYPECTKGAQGSTMFCKSHGGGRRCTFMGCTKGAEGSTSYCKRHGGGKRCASEDCTKSVHGGTLFCVSHGGGKRCTMSECTKSARGRTDYCVRHGGGKRCKFEGCTKSAQGSTDFCKRHAQVQQEEPVVAVAEDLETSISTQMKGIVASGDSFSCSATLNKDCDTASISLIGLRSLPNSYQENFTIERSCVDGFSLPEGRVHGGSLMAMLSGKSKQSPFIK